MPSKKKSGKKSPSAVKPVRTKSVAVPVARTTTERAEGPKFKQSANGSIRVQRREFVGTVTNGASTVYVLDANSSSSPGWDFNPGNSTLFPWLSIMAPSYERFRFNKLSFELVSSQASSTAGRIYASVDYDWDDEVPATKAQLMGNMTAQEAPIWTNLRIICDPRQLHRDMPYKFVNLGTRVTYSEPRTAYAGFLIIGFDTPTANCRYDMFVSYDISLEVPVFENVGATLSNPIPIAPVAPYVVERNPWYDATATGFKMVQALWSSNTTKGLIREVVGGAADVPTLSTPTFPPSWSGFAQKALDIGRLGAKHWLTIEGYLKESTLSPSQWGAYSYADALAYDGLGVLLGGVRSSQSATVAGLVCSDNSCGFVPSEQGTAGKSVRPSLGFSLESLRNIFPSVRYILPLLMVGNSLGLGSVAGTIGIDYRIW